MGAVPSKPDPTKSMQVIGAGMARTGTNSMQLALQMLLDGPVQHGGTQLLTGSTESNRNWLYAMRASRLGDKERALKYTRKSTAGFVGICDFPAVAVLAEMLEIYPDAKVVLVTRDPDKWWISMKPVMDNGMNSFHMLLTAISPTLRWLPPIFDEIIIFLNMLIGRSSQGTSAEGWGPFMLETYNKRVLEMVPKEKLLVMDLSQGWEPLCKFLGKPVPNVPFPRTNDSVAVDRTAKKVVGKLILMWLGLFTVVGGTTYGGWMLWNKSY